VATTSGEARGLARYGELFANRHAGALLAWSIVARLPLGMAALALVLLVRDAGGDYGEAGLVTAVYGIAVAIGAPYGGRQVDRRGARTILHRRNVLYPSLFVVVALLGAAGAPVALIAVAAAAAGVTLAPISAVLRSIWPTVAGADGANTAYSLDAALQEMIWVGGPLVVAALAVFSPVAAVAGVAVVAAVGTFSFTRIPPVHEAAPAEERHASRWGALAAVGVRTLCVMSVFVGLGFGAVEIAVPGFADVQGNRALAGIGLAGFAAGSLVGGLIAGLFPLRDERRRIIVGSFVLAGTLALPLAATSMLTMTILLFFAGLPIAPTVAAIYGLLGRVTVAGSVAEAFSWFGTSIAIGIAGGSLAGGVLIDSRGWRWSVLLGLLCVAVAGVLVTVRRGTLALPEEGA
jgi:MFS family permease